jgi:hypothetical protein
MPDITCPADIESLIQSKKIVITGLALERTKVLTPDSSQIDQELGEQSPSITIPADQDQIENGVKYWPVLCLQTLEKIDKIYSYAKLTKIDHLTAADMDSIPLPNWDINKIIVPFPDHPDNVPHNLYHRLWKWPEIGSWGQVATYKLQIWFGCARDTIDPQTKYATTVYEWTKNPVSEYTLTIEKEKPAKP